MMAVASDEGASQTDLVEATGIDRSTTAGIVKRLCRKRLLQRRRTREDARAYAVKLTDEGRRVLSVTGPAARRVDDRVLAALPEKQREVFLTALASIVKTLQALAPDKSESSLPRVVATAHGEAVFWFEGSLRKSPALLVNGKPLSF